MVILLLDCYVGVVQKLVEKLGNALEAFSENREICDLRLETRTPMVKKATSREKELNIRALDSLFFLSL